MTEDIVDRIYEAAFVPEKWPSVLDALAALSGSVGGALLATGVRHPPRWAASEIVAPALREYVAGGAWKRNKRPEQILSSGHTGFSRDIDLWTDQELDRYRDSDERSQHGLGWQLGSIIPMPTGDTVIFSLDRRFEDGPHDVAMRDVANSFHPHLARAGLLAARLGLERARTAVATLEAIGLPAAVITSSDRVLVTNGLLDQSQIFQPAAHGELILSDVSANRLFKDAIFSTGAGLSVSRSIPMPVAQDRSAAIIHVLPLGGAAYDIFSGGSMLIIATTVSMSVRLSEPTLLQGLFDLSPAEAKLAAALSSGRTLKQAAEDGQIRLSTARSYMENIFRKTGVHQQSQLVALLKSTEPLMRQP